MEFEFVTTVVYSSGKYKVVTNAGTVFILGSLFGISDVVTAEDGFQANGTSIVGIDMVGTTTGGLVGGSFKLTAISSTVWFCSGYFFGSGTLATPFV